jgi:hypothetical protein
MSDRELTLRPDAKGRITLGPLAKGVSSFRVQQQADGKLVLEPFKEIPAREAWLFENPDAIGRVRRGLADAAAGKTRIRGDFSSFADSDADE